MTNPKLLAPFAESASSELMSRHANSVDVFVECMTRDIRKLSSVDRHTLMLSFPEAGRSISLALATDEEVKHAVPDYQLRVRKADEKVQEVASQIAETPADAGAKFLSLVEAMNVQAFTEICCALVMDELSQRSVVQDRVRRLRGVSIEGNTDVAQ